MKIIVGPIGSGKTRKVFELAMSKVLDDGAYVEVLSNEYDLKAVSHFPEFDRVFKEGEDIGWVSSNLKVFNLTLSSLGFLSKLLLESQADAIFIDVVGLVSSAKDSSQPLNDKILNLLAYLESYTGKEYYVTVRSSLLPDTLSVVDYVVPTI